MGRLRVRHVLHQRQPTKGSSMQTDPKPKLGNCYTCQAGKKTSESQGTLTSVFPRAPGRAFPWRVICSKRADRPRPVAVGSVRAVGAWHRAENVAQVGVAGSKLSSQVPWFGLVRLVCLVWFLWLGWLVGWIDWFQLTSERVDGPQSVAGTFGLPLKWSRPKKSKNSN